MNRITRQHYRALADKPIVSLEQAARYRAKVLTGLEAIPTWPILNGTIRINSGELREESGDAAWASEGGEFDSTGYATLRDDSALGAAVMQHYVQDVHRFRYLDESECPWAIVLREADHIPGQAIALGGPGSGFLFGAASRASLNLRVNQELERARSQADGKPQEQRSHEEILEDQSVSYEAAAAMLTVLKAKSDQQRSARITIDEVDVASILWGKNLEFWPRRWRERLADAFCLLDSLQLREVKVLPGHWRPRFDARHRLWHSIRELGTHQLEICLNPLLLLFLSA